MKRKEEFLIVELFNRLDRCHCVLHYQIQYFASNKAQTLRNFETHFHLLNKKDFYPSNTNLDLIFEFSKLR